MLHATPNLIHFFFNDTATTEIYTLSLHDALPIYAAHLIFDRVLNRDEFVVVAFDFIDGRIQRGRLAGARRPRDQHHAVRFMNVAAEAIEFFGGEADHVQSQVGKFLGKRFFVEDAKNRVFAVASGHDGHAQVDVAAFILHAEAAVLRNAALGDIQFAQDFYAREHGRMMFLGDGLHGVLQDAVDAVLHGHFRVAGLNMDIAGSTFESSKDDGFNQAHHRAGRAIPSQAITGDRLFGFLFLLGSLERKRFRSLFENALRLLGALQYVGNLPGRGNTNQQLLAEQQRQFVTALNQSRICSGD